MQSKKNVVIITVAIVLLVAAAVLFANVWRQRKPTVATSVMPTNSIQLPETVFDSTTTLQGTHVSFGYPSNGFYGQGNKLFPQPPSKIDPELIAGVATNPTSPYDAEKGSESVVLNVSLYRNTTGLTLEKYVTNFREGSYDEVYAKANGKFLTIGSHRYFIYKVAEDVTVWSAYAISTEGFVHVTLAYKPTDGAESKAAYVHNDDLFLEILSHVTFD